MIGVPNTSLGSDAPRALPSDAMTHVVLTWIEKKIEFWIRFGREAAEQILHRQGRVVSFVTDSLFAFVRWTSIDYRPARSPLHIVLAVRAREPSPPHPSGPPRGPHT